MDNVDREMDQVPQVLGRYNETGSEGASISHHETDQEVRPSSVAPVQCEPHSQAGVQSIEAITSTWTKTSLVLAYVMIWLIYLVMLLQQGSLGALTPFVTSAFQKYSLTPTVGIISNIIGGLCQLSLAKVLDIFGRPPGYLLSIFLTTLGLIMMSACNSVELYAAAQVFYTVGQSAMFYTLNIFVADTSSLRNRGLMMAFSASPNLIVVWLFGPVAQAFQQGGPGWRWAFGAFGIAVPVITLPLYGLLIYNLYIARQQGLLENQEKRNEKSAVESCIYYAREFDAIGLLLLSAGLALLLLPFNIHASQAQGWHSPLVVSFLVVGLSLIFAFALWEKYFAPIPFIPIKLLLDRTVLGACVLSSTLFISYYCWFSFFSPFLMVVHNLSFKDATYVANVYSVGNTIWSLAVGWLIRSTGRYKPVVLWFAIPMHIFGLGLMINFLDGTKSIGYIIMCQVFISFGGGTIIICDQLAVMAAAYHHQHVAVVLALEAMFAQIGGALGLTISGLIWQSVFPVKLAEYLPTEDLSNLTAIYADLNTQLTYPVGSFTRTGIAHAYGDAQKMLLISGTAIWVVGFVATLAWRDINVKDTKQTKGQVV